ncbi:MAG: YARHG domain-containing protein [Flavobacteriales bacterium]
MRMFLFFAAVSAIIACTNLFGNKTQPTAEVMIEARQAMKLEAPKPIAVTPQLNITSKEDLIGYWVGTGLSMDTTATSADMNEYNYEKINFSIDSIQGDLVFGHTVWLGKSRAFKGNMQNEGGFYMMRVNQEGDDKWVGTFIANIAQSDSVMNIVWEPQNTKIDQSIDLTLTKTLFVYSPDYSLEDGGQFIDYQKSKQITETYIDEDGQKHEYVDDSYFTTTDEVFKYNPSKQLLTKEQVENMTKADIFVLRNSIYARHGFAFHLPALRDYFGYMGWYVPVRTSIEHELSDTEIKNIELLMRYEEHAKEFYDVFGR